MGGRGVVVVEPEREECGDEFDVPPAPRSFRAAVHAVMPPPQISGVVAKTRFAIACLGTVPWRLEGPAPNTESRAGRGEDIRVGLGRQ